MPHRISYIAWFSLTLGCLVSATSAQTVRTVALSDNLAPGTNSSANFSTFFFPVINSAGRVAFRGGLDGPSVNESNNSGIWSEPDENGLTLVASTGDAAPGTLGETLFSSFGSPRINASGQTAFYAGLGGMGVSHLNNKSIWSEGNGAGLTLVARTGSPAPGANAGETFSYFNGPAFNDAGQTVFRGALAGPEVGIDNNKGIWSEGAGNGLALIAREGNAAPNSASGVTFANLDTYFDPGINSEGQTVFRGSLTGPSIDSGNNRGVWLDSEETGLGLLALNGNAAPGIPSGETFIRFSSDPVINNAGHVAFMAYFTNPDPDRLQKAGIWSAGGGNGLALVASAGSAAPGTGSGVDYAGFFFTGPVLNGAGETAFVGMLEGTGVNATNNEGIWSEGAGADLALVARTADAAPGTESGVVFSDLVDVLLGRPALNIAGQTAFRGRLSGVGVNESNDEGIWAEDRLGELTLIAREGDLLDVDDGPQTDFRTISKILFDTGSGNEDGYPGGFNDQGQLAFTAQFTNGSSGVFVSNLVAAPLVTADFDEDGDVDGADLLMWQRSGSPSPLSATDLALWETQYGSAIALPQTIGVPEPESLLLAAWMVVGLLVRAW